MNNYFMYMGGQGVHTLTLEYERECGQTGGGTEAEYSVSIRFPEPMGVGSLESKTNNILLPPVLSLLYPCCHYYTAGKATCAACQSAVISFRVKPFETLHDVIERLKTDAAM